MQSALDEITAVATDNEGVRAWLLWLRAYVASVRRGLHKDKPSKTHTQYRKWTLSNLEILKPSSAGAFRLVQRPAHDAWMARLFDGARGKKGLRQRAVDLQPLITEALVELEADARTDSARAVDDLEMRTDQISNTAAVLEEAIAASRARVAELERAVAEFEAREAEWKAAADGAAEDARLLKAALEKCKSKDAFVQDVLALPPPPPPPSSDSLPDLPPPPPPIVSSPASLTALIEATAREIKTTAAEVEASNDTEGLLGSILAGRDSLRGIPADFDIKREAARREGDNSVGAILARRIAVAGSDAEDDDEGDEGDDWGEWAEARYPRARFTRAQARHILEAVGGDVAAAGRLGQRLGQRA